MIYKMDKTVKQALERFNQVLDSLECECHDGYTCTIHSDKILVEKALEIVNKKQIKRRNLIDDYFDGVC